MKKVLALFLAALMVSAFAACSNGNTPSGGASSDNAAPSQVESAPESKEESKEVTYPLEDGGTLSIAWAEKAAITAGNKAWKDTPFIQGLEKNTGVTLEIFHPTDFNLYLAGGEYADIIYHGWNGYTGGAAKAISDGIIIPIEDYLEANAPDYKKFIESNELWSKQASAVGGQRYGFNFVRTDEVLLTNSGMIIREDWLNDLGMEAPETLDEFKNVLIAFRDKKGAKSPLSVNQWVLRGNAGGYITGAFGIPVAALYVENDTVKFGPYEDAYKDYLTYISELYREGLIEKNFLTIEDKTVTSNFMNGDVGVVVGSGGGGIGNLMTNAENVGNTAFSVTGVTPLVKNKGDRAIGGQIDNPVTGSAAAISSDCKNVELACRFLNYGYTEEGHDYWNFGTKDESYTIVNDNEYYTHAYTDKVLKAEGLTVQQGMAQYSMAWDNGCFGQDQDYIWQFYARQQQKNALSNWTKTDAGKYKLPALSIAEDDLDDYSNISAEIETYVAKTVAAFIVGDASMDTFEEFRQTLKDIGVEKYIAYTQAAYDEYKSR